MIAKNEWQQPADETQPYPFSLVGDTSSATC
jgi:hypothetical protein